MRAMNAIIRAAAGYGPAVTDAQPEGDQAAPKLPTANAGDGAAGPAPDVETTADKMNRWLRARGRGFA